MTDSPEIDRPSLHPFARFEAQLRRRDGESLPFSACSGTIHIEAANHWRFEFDHNPLVFHVPKNLPTTRLELAIRAVTGELLFTYAIPTVQGADEIRVEGPIHLTVSSV